jgi:hypothetical protein
LGERHRNEWGALRAGAGPPGPRATPWSPILLALLLVNIILFCSAAAVRHQPPTSDPVFQKLEAIVKTISEITGFEQKHAVPYGRMNHDQLRKFLAKRLKATLRPEELHADELSLKLFGLVPQDFDLKKSTVDLLTEQAAAFYDYQEKRLFILDTSSLSEEEITLAHELSHALADQHFNMEKFMEEEPANDDENLAHSAVVEGQATWLMMAYQMKKVGLTPAPTPEMLAQAAGNTEASNSQYPVLDKSPIYIQRSLLFPYDEGTLFFDAVYRKLGQPAFARVFTDPPVDSSQILHPDRYFAHQHATKPPLPAWKPKDKNKEVASGTVGEFDHYMLLFQYDGKEEADRRSPHLKGGVYKILEVGPAKSPLLEFASEWDSPDQAQAFFADYQKVLRGKWKTFQPSASLESEFSGHAENGYFTVRWSGALITSVEGIQSEEEWTRLVRQQAEAANKLVNVSN